MERLPEKSDSGMHHESEILGEGGKPMRKHRITAVMAAMFCMILMAGCGNSKAVQEQQMTLRSQGMEQAKEGDYEAAVASYDEALGLSDMYVGNLEMDIAAYKASALYAEENTEDAIAVCSAVLDVKKSQEMYLTRGLLYRAAENREAANADFASADICLLRSKDNGRSFGEEKTIMTCESEKAVNIMSLSFLEMKNGDVGLFLSGASDLYTYVDVSPEICRWWRKLERENTLYAGERLLCGQ